MGLVEFACELTEKDLIIGMMRSESGAIPLILLPREAATILG